MGYSAVPVRAAHTVPTPAPTVLLRSRHSAYERRGGRYRILVSCTFDELRYRTEHFLPLGAIGRGAMTRKLGSRSPLHARADKVINKRVGPPLPNFYRPEPALPGAGPSARGI